MQIETNLLKTKAEIEANTNAMNLKHNLGLTPLMYVLLGNLKKHINLFLCQTGHKRSVS